MTHLLLKRFLDRGSFSWYIDIYRNDGNKYVAFQDAERPREVEAVRRARGNTSRSGGVKTQ